MKHYTRLQFEDINNEQKEVLLAWLTEVGFIGFEEGPQSLMAYIAEEDYDEDRVTELPASFPLHFQKERIAEENWNAQWEKDFQPVRIGDFCGIRASFHAPISGVQYDIQITPKMSFGTGHHATTHLMVEFMRSLDVQHKTVLDFGTGTGILAILAGKMGAGPIVAIDNDDWSITNAAENFILNHCDHIHLEKADKLEMHRHFEIILANINRNVLLNNMSSIKEHLKPGGTLVMSGLLQGDQSIIEEAASNAGLSLKQVLERNGWIALSFTTA